MAEWAVDRESKRSHTLSLLSPSMFLKLGKAARWVRAASLLSILGVDMWGSANVSLSFFAFVVSTHIILHVLSSISATTRSLSASLK